MPRFCVIGILLLAFLFNNVNLHGQCPANVPITIADNATRVLNFRITNATNNNLANENQGVCQVKLRMNHGSIGDVNLTLVSPNGQRVRLIQTSGSKSTINTTWDISFVPCSEEAQPDTTGFFKPVWDSDQNWGVDGAYTGKYYPVECLENFNSGSIVGFWKLIVEDASPLQTGRIEFFEVIFCDQSGVSCNNCEAPISRMESDTIIFCGNDQALQNYSPSDLEFVTDYDGTLYDFVFIAVSNQEVIQIGKQLNLAGMKKGLYLIYGLAYLKSDFVDFDEFIDKPIGNIAAAISGLQVDRCGRYSMGIKVIQILSDSEITATTVLRICKGDSLQLSNQTVYQQGIYLDTLQTMAGCDSIISIEVEIFEIGVPILIGGERLSCENPTQSLTWINDQFAKQPDLRWFTSDGNIITEPFGPSVQINLPGRYALEISSDGCVDTGYVNIVDDSSLPDIELPSVFRQSCTNDDSIEIKPNSNGISFEWIGPNGFQSNSKDISVNMQGEYLLTVEGNQCSATKKVQVLGVQLGIDSLIIIDPNMICSNDSIQLRTNWNVENSSFLWSGPDGFSSSEEAPKNNKPGLYQVEVAVDDICTVQTQRVIQAKNDATSLQVIPRNINCRYAQGGVLVDFAGQDATFRWSGPNNFVSIEQSPELPFEGTYYLEVSDESQCHYFDTVLIQIDTMKPLVNVPDATVNCANDAILIQPDVQDTSAAIFIWSGPNGIQQISKEFMANQTGNYRLIVRNGNFCQTSDFFDVKKEGGEGPPVSVSFNAINCLADESVVALDLGSCSDCSVSWSNVMDEEIGTNDTLIVSSPGEYEAKISSPSFVCPSNIVANVRQDLSVHRLGSRVVKADIGCSTPGSVVLNNANLYTDIFWIDTLNQDTLSGTSLEFTEPQEFKLVVVGRNGCLDSMFVQIVEDIEVPQFEIVFDTLDCKTTETTLIVRPSNYEISEIATLDWTLSNGEQSTSISPIIDQPGEVEVTLTTTTGCVNSGSLIVVTDFEEPAVNASGGTLTCGNNNLQLQLSTNTPTSNVVWNGPDQFSSFEFSPTVFAPGIYQVIATGANGCSGSDTAVVIFDDDVPVVTLSADDLTCKSDLTEISFTSNVDALDFSWRDPIGNIINSSTITTSQPGTYFLDFIGVKGCQTSESIVVRLDTSVILHQLTSDILTCGNNPVVIQLDTVLSDASYKWFADSEMLGEGSLFQIEEAREYILVVDGNNGCSRTFNHIVIGDTVVPRFVIPDDTLSCSNEKVTLRPNILDGNYTYDWSGPNQFRSDASAIAATQPGFYQLRITGSNGCFFEDESVVSVDFESPEIELFDAILPCSEDSIAFEFNSLAREIVEFNWFGPNGLYSEDSVLLTRELGEYFFQAKASNGCSSLDSAELVLPQFDTIQIQTENINCENELGLLFIEQLNDEFVYEWSLPDGSNSSDSMLATALVGEFSIAATHLPTQCFFTDTASIRIDTLAPTIDIIHLDSIICASRIARVLVPVDPNININWSTEEGQILSNSIDSILVTNQPGLYQVSLFNPENQCYSDSLIEVIELPSDVVGVEFQSINASCNGQNDGVIQVDSVIGGVEPYQIGINTEFLIVSSAIFNLKPDTFTLTIEDVNGCRMDTIAIVERTTPFLVDLGPDTTIFLGDSITLFGQLTEGDSQLLDFKWFLSFAECLDCGNQQSISIAPLDNIFVSIKANSTTCSDSDTLQIRVAGRDGFYAPNAFTPNADNVNDLWKIFFNSNQIVEVSEYKVFDRDGTLLFEAQDCIGEPNKCGWNGTYNGENMLPGIYVYKITYSDILGKIRTKAGEFVLIR